MKRDLYESPTVNYEELVERISASYVTAQAKAVNAVNANLLEAYWELR